MATTTKNADSTPSLSSSSSSSSSFSYSSVVNGPMLSVRVKCNGVAHQVDQNSPFIRFSGLKPATIYKVWVCCTYASGEVEEELVIFKKSKRKKKEEEERRKKKKEEERRKKKEERRRKKQKGKRYQ